MYSLILVLLGWSRSESPFPKGLNHLWIKRVLTSFLFLQHFYHFLLLCFKFILFGTSLKKILFEGSSYLMFFSVIFYFYGQTFVMSWSTTQLGHTHKILNATKKMSLRMVRGVFAVFWASTLSYAFLEIKKYIIVLRFQVWTLTILVKVDLCYTFIAN